MIDNNNSFHRLLEIFPQNWGDTVDAVAATESLLLPPFGSASGTNEMDFRVCDPLQTPLIFSLNCLQRGISGRAVRCTFTWAWILDHITKRSAFPIIWGWQFNYSPYLFIQKSLRLVFLQQLRTQFNYILLSRASKALLPNSTHLLF